MSKESKKKTEKEIEPKQLGLEIKEPAKNKFYKAKRKFDFAVLKLEVIKFLKDPLVWAVLVFGIVMIAFQVNLIFKNINSIPKYVPLFRFYIAPKNMLVESKYIYIVPILTGVIVLISMIFVSKNYNREKHLTKILLVSTIIAILFLSFTLVQSIKL